MPRFRVAFDDLEYFFAVQVRHHHVQQDKAEFLRTQQPDRFLAPGGAHYPLVTIRFEEQLQRIPVVVVVIDDKDARDV
jgi:hypothetical protein